VQSVPIVSLTGDSIPESLSRAILAQFNLEQDTLVTSVDTYVAKAIAFGRDAVLRKETSIKIREKIIQMNDRSGNRQFLTGFWNEIDKLLQSRM
jgi:predicted O-linked N-acetylglucosamine transferase (SPINDLY family)